MSGTAPPNPIYGTTGTGYNPAPTTTTSSGSISLPPAIGPTTPGATYVGYSGMVIFETIAASGEYVISADGAAGSPAYFTRLGSFTPEEIAGGSGAVVTGTFALAANTVLEIVSGGEGTSGGGGGGTFVYDVSTGILLEAAGGGGGSSRGFNNYGLSGGGPGKATYSPGGLGGAAGYGLSNTYGGGAGGGGIASSGGTATGSNRFGGAGGAGGDLTSAKGSIGGNGVQLPTTGGSLGGGFGGGGGGNQDGGGGGGGFSGGNGGNNSSDYVQVGGGGGGGGSFLATSSTNPNNILTAVGTNPGNGFVAFEMVCFADGTKILTERGEIAVEALKVGDRVVTQSGGTEPVIWLGRRHIDIARHPSPEKVKPVLVSAGALSDGIPSSDLVLSQDHALFFEGHLIPAKALLNGHSIRLLNMGSVTYYHVELSSHDVIFAEGTPVETYLETGNRNFFEDSDAMLLHPDFAQTMRVEKSCAVFAESGAFVESVREQILDRAHLTLSSEHNMTVEFNEYGAIIRSNSAIPGYVNRDPRDLRQLGVKISSLRIGGRDLPIDHPLLIQGWHDIEHDGRWTNGAAVIPAELLGGQVSLEVDIISAMQYPKNNPLSQIALHFGLKASQRLLM